MKKIYSILAALLLGTTAQAQSVDFKSTLVKPTAGTTWEAGKYAPFELTVTIMSGSIGPTDTVWYGFTDGSSIYGRYNMTKNTGDTISFKNNLGYGTGVVPKTNYKWCTWVYGVKVGGTKITDPTSTNDTSCTTINIINKVGIGTGPSTASADNDGVTLSLVPNPASGDAVSFNFYSGSNSAEIRARIIDITGRTVSTQSFNRTIDGSYRLNVADLRSGIYFVEVVQGESRVLGKLNKL